jgi:hypothetical protein
LFADGRIITTTMRQRINSWLDPFKLHEFLRAETAHVLNRLPADVLEDVMGEGGIVLYDYEPGPGVVMEVPVRAPSRLGAARSVVLKRTLCRRPPTFVRWLIAHELAHAHLRNGGRWPGDDPEHAADALATNWGFPRPVNV